MNRKKVILIASLIISCFIDSYAYSKTKTNNPYNYISLASEAKKLKKFNIAIKWLRKALTVTDNDKIRSEIYFRLADCYYYIKNQIAAFNLYKEGLKYPDAEKYLLSHPKIYIHLANIYFDYSQYQKAVNIYIQIAKIYKNKDFTPYVLVKAGDSYLNLKKYKDALRMYSKVVLLFKNTDEYWISRFRMADIGISNPQLNIPDTIEYRDYRKPLEAYIDIIKRAPRELKKLKQLAQLRIASVSIKNRKYQQAIDVTKNFIKNYPNSTLKEYAKEILINATSKFVDFLYQNRDLIKICKLYESIKTDIDISKLKPDTTKKIADSLYNLDLYSDALRLYMIDPKHNISRIAAIYNRLGRYKETINLLKDREKNLSSEMLLVLATALYKEKRFKDVTVLLEKYINKVSNIKAYYILADSFDKLGNRKKAIYYYEILSKKKSKYQLNACLYLANIYFDLKQYKKALHYYQITETLCNRCPDTDFIRLQIANCYYEIGDYKKSASTLKQVKSNNLMGWVSNVQLQIMELENTYKELKWLIE